MDMLSVDVDTCCTVGTEDTTEDVDVVPSCVVWCVADGVRGLSIEYLQILYKCMKSRHPL